MNDYIIAVDRDGQPYIAHAWKDHKYIAKIKDRYFYTQEQLRAFQQGAKQGFEKGINNKRLNSFTEKAASKVNKSGEKMNANGKFGPTVTEKGEKVGYNAGKAIRNASNKVNNSTDKVQDKVKSTTERIKEDLRKRSEERNNKAKNKEEVTEKELKQLEASNEVAIKMINRSNDLKTRSDDVKHGIYKDKNGDLVSISSNSLDKYKKEAEKINEDVKKLETDFLNGTIKYNEYESKLNEHDENLNKLQKEFYAEVDKIWADYYESDKEKKIRDSASKSKFSEYTKGDKDFDDKNFAEKNRVGDSDFFMAKRPDGSTVILEEDMKWVLPKGVNPNDPAIKRALTKEYKAGSNEEWVKQVTEAIDNAVEEANKKK